ncbi:MAG TPA: hypothetical protein ENG87_01535 [Candidatus Pacearchaeota archaeon]|nr:hypothetical protein [Candidatus Pacearchaeota archaeon]
MIKETLITNSQKIVENSNSKKMKKEKVSEKEKRIVFLEAENYFLKKILEQLLNINLIHYPIF